MLPTTPALVDIRNSMAGWHFDSAEVAAAKRGDYMLNASLDLSNPCNLNCPYCYIEEKNSTRKLRRPDELSMAETMSVVEGFARAGAKTVNLVGAGEPTIDPSFLAVVTSIVNAGMVPVVFTNGIRLAEDSSMVQFLADCGATVALKFNALDPKVQDLLVGRRGYTIHRDVALKNLISLQFNIPRPTRLALDIIAVRGNRDDIPEIHRMCRQQNILPILGDLIPTGRTEKGQFVGHAALTGIDRHETADLLQPLSSAERVHIYNQLRDIDATEFGIHHQPNPAYYSGFGCTQLLGLYVDIRGNIWPCVARTQKVGHEWRGEPLGNVRRGDEVGTVWTTARYLSRLRDQYSGECPYKPQLAATENFALSHVPQRTRLSLPITQ